jgi:formylglycine-generating enzyme required for sulfatase activity
VAAAARLRIDDFHLRFEGAGGGGWVVAVENASAGTSARAPLQWPLLPAALQRAWTTRCTMRRDLGAGVEMASLEEVGDALFRTVFAGEVGECLRSGLDHAQQYGSGLRLWIHPGGQPMLDALPWEVLFDRRGERFLAQSERTPVVRYLDNAEPLRRQRLRKPLRVLLPTACPSDRQPLNAGGELKAIEEALACRAGDVVLEPLAGATLEKLRLRLDDGSQPCHVVHFIGHAGFDAAVKAGALVFEEGGGSRTVGARHLGPLLLDHDALQLLVLNACEGCKIPFQGNSPGLAQALMRQRIPAVVAMQVPITDSAAIAFAGHLYAALASGCTIDVALARCRKAMFPHGREGEWAASVLYLRSAQASLLPVRSRAGGEPAAPGMIASRSSSARGRRRSWLAAAALLVGAGCLWFWLGQHGRVSPAAPGAGDRLVARRLPGSPPAKPRADPPVRAGSPAPAVAAGYGPVHAAASPPEVPECPPAPELAMKFMRLGPGTFLMGSLHGGAADERPAHYVTLSVFCMAAYEVTQGQWREVMGEAADETQRNGDDLPVEEVSWDDVQVFLARLNQLAGRLRYRLPTEAEWEYAARAGSGSAYSFGDDPGELYRFGNCKSLEHDDGFDREAPVGSFLPNRWGLYDLYGNASEWVEDAYGRYGADPVKDPHVLDGPLRVRRGGSWLIIPKNCRSAFRNKSRPDTRKNDVGFRVVRLVGE